MNKMKVTRRGTRARIVIDAGGTQMVMTTTTEIADEMADQLTLISKLLAKGGRLSFVPIGEEPTS